MATKNHARDEQVEQICLRMPQRIVRGFKVEAASRGIYPSQLAIEVFSSFLARQAKKNHVESQN